MSIKKGDVIFHVSVSGKITTVIAQGPEHIGSIPVKLQNGSYAQIGMMHLFSDLQAANRVALDRLSPEAREVMLIRNGRPDEKVTLN